MIIAYSLAGLVSGFFSSTPLGPINLWVADHRLSRLPLGTLLYFLTAVIIVDISFASGALWGHFEVWEESQEMKWVGVFSGIFTSILGLILISKARNNVVITRSTTSLNKYSSFLQGIVLTAANPAFVLFWLFVANQIMSHIDKTLTYYELISFVCGVVIGDVLWFTFFTFILSKFSKKSQDSTLRRIRLMVGIVFFVIGATGVITYVLK